MEGLQALSKTGLEQAKECLSLLKYSEGLVKRDIDLARCQLETKLKRLEDRAHAELKDIVENESFKVEEVIAEVNEIMKCSQGDLQSTSFNDARLRIIKQIDQLEKIRIRFSPNFDIENFIDKANSIGSLSLLRLKADIPALSEVSEDVLKTNVNMGVEGLGIDKPSGRIRAPVSGLVISSNESSSVSSLEDERHAPEGEMTDVSNTCSGHAKNNVELEVLVPNKNMTIRVEPSKDYNTYEKPKTSHLPINSPGNRARDNCSRDEDVVKDNKDQSNLPTFDPLSLLRSMKNFENEMKQYPLPPEFRTDDDKANSVTGLGSSLPRGSTHAHDIATTNSTRRRANTISSDHASYERGRDIMRSRIPVIRSRSTSPGTVIRDKSGTNSDDEDKYKHNHHSYVPDPKTRVLLANEMWFGPHVPDNHARSRSASFGSKNNNPRVRTRQEHEDAHQPKQKSHELESHHHSHQQTKAKSHNSHTGHFEPQQSDDSILTHAEPDSKIHSETIVLYKQVKPVQKQEENNRQKQKQVSARNTLSVKEKRSRNRSIPSDITQVLKDARKQESLETGSDDRNRNEKGPEHHPGHNSNDGNRERRTQPVNIPIYISNPEEHYTSNSSIDSVQERNTNCPNIEHNTRADSSKSKEGEIRTHISSKDRRRRNRTIAGDISGFLKEARSLNTDTHTGAKCAELEGKENTNSGIAVDNHNAGMDRREARRCKTISEDISEVLKAARAFVTESNSNNTSDLSQSRTDTDISTCVSVTAPQTKTALHLTPEDSFSHSKRMFSRRRCLHKDDDDRMSTESSSSESDGPGLMKTDRRVGRLQIPVPNRLRIPSFDEMLYNQNK